MRAIIMEGTGWTITTTRNTHFYTIMHLTYSRLF